MKKWIILFIACSIASFCTAQQGYDISGNVEGVSNGKIYILNVISQWEIDTLTEADIVDGKFALQGSVKEPLCVAFGFEGQNQAISFFLENVNYRVKLDVVEPKNSVIEGGYEQSVHKQLEKIYMENLVKKQEISTKIMANRTQDEMEELQKDFAKIEDQLRIDQMVIIKENPNSHVSKTLVQAYTKMYALPIIKSAFELLSDEMKNSEWGKDMAEYIALRERTDFGQTALDFAFMNVAGRKMNMYDVKGKVKVVIFGTFLEEDARQRNRAFEESYKELHEKGLEVISISLDKDQKAWAKIVEEDKLSWIQGIISETEREHVAYLFGIIHPIKIFVLGENNVILTGGYLWKDLKDRVIKELGNN